MNAKLSLSQWSTIALLDLLLRSGVFFFRSLNVLTIPIAIFLSALHLLLLISVFLFVNTFDIAIRRKIVVALAATNTLFFMIVVSIWVSFIKSGRQSACVDQKCSWVDGTITAFGMQTIAFESLVQFAVNIAVFLLVLSFAFRRAPRPAP
jgi:hypothetical protein